MSIPFPISEYTTIEVEYGIHEINTPYDLTSEVDTLKLFEEYIDVYEMGDLSDPPGYIILCNQTDPVENGLYKFYEVDTSRITNPPYVRFLFKPSVFKSDEHILVGMMFGLMGTRLHLYQLCRFDSDTGGTRGDMYKQCFKYQLYKDVEPIGYVCINHGVIGIDPLTYVKTKCGDIEELRQQVGMLTEKIKSLEQYIKSSHSEQDSHNVQVVQPIVRRSFVSYIP